MSKVFWLSFCFDTLDHSAHSELDTLVQLDHGVTDDLLIVGDGLLAGAASVHADTGEVADTVVGEDIAGNVEAGTVADTVEVGTDAVEE